MLQPHEGRIGINHMIELSDRLDDGGIFANSKQGNSDLILSSMHWEMDQIPKKKGRKCDFAGCDNIHGSRKDPEPGEKKGKTRSACKRMYWML